VVRCPDNALSDPGVITVTVIAEHLDIHQAAITAQTGYSDTVVGYGCSDPGDVRAVVITIGIWCGTVGEIDAGDYFAS